MYKEIIEVIKALDKTNTKQLKNNEIRKLIKIYMLFTKWFFFDFAFLNS